MMEIEPAAVSEFVEDISLLKPPDEDDIKKDIDEINGNDSITEDEIDVKLSDSLSIKEKAKVNDNDCNNIGTEEEFLNNSGPDTPVDNAEKVNNICETNGNTEDATSENKPPTPTPSATPPPAPAPVPMEESVKEEDVKDEPMDVDADPDGEPEPVFESQDKSEKLEEPLFEETIIDGFSFSAFDKYTVLEECCKWSAQNPGKVPDPRYKLKFRPKEKPVKIKKEKKEKELTKKQKEKLEKISAHSTPEKHSGYNCDNEKSDSEKGSDGVSDPHFAKRSLNGLPGLSPSHSRPNGLQSTQSGPLNFSKPHPSLYPHNNSRSGQHHQHQHRHHPAHHQPPHQAHHHQPHHHQAHHQPSHQQRSSGLYRPYEVSPTSSRQPPQSQPAASGQSPAAPRQIYSAPSHSHSHSHSLYPGQPQPHQSHHGYSGPQVHPAYRPPGTTTAGPAPAHHKPYQQQHQHQHQHQQQHYYGRSYPGYPPPHKGYQQAGYSAGYNGVTHSSQPATSITPSRDSYSSSPAHQSYTTTSDSGANQPKLNPWQSSGYSSGAAGLPGAGGAAGAGGGGVSSELTASPSLAPHSRPGQFQPGSSPLTSSPAATILPPTPMMKDVPKLGGPDSLFFRAGLEGGYGSRLSSLSSSSGQFPGSASQAGQTKKTGKWNAMHVRIAWEIYNHQQKAKTDAKSSVSPAALSSAKLGNSSFDLLNKTGVTPGADYIGKRPGPPQDLLRAHNPSSIFPGSLGSVGSVLPPPNPFDPLQAARDPFGASRYYGSAHLGSAAAAPYPGHPRYPTAGSGAPFGGLGGIIPPPVTASHLGSHTPRPAHPSYPAYPGVHHGLKEKEEAERRAKERREAEERERERERRHREEVQQARDSEARASREGFPAYVRDVREVREREKNGEERERSPVRGEAGEASQQSLQGVDMRVTPTSRPPSSLSQDQASTVKSAGGDPGGVLTKKEERICDDISIIAEKEGTRSGANSVTGRASANSDHSISRLNGLEGSSQSPLVNSNGVKSDSPHQAPHQARPAYPGPASLYPGQVSGRAGQPGVPPPVSSYLPPSHPSHHPLAPPPPASHDPRTLAMFPHMAMSAGSLRPPNPLDPYGSYAAAAAMDPFRLELLSRDPYREAREREMLRLTNPLSSLVNSAELERAKAQALGLTPGYPSLPGAYPGYPPTTLAAAANASLAAHKMNLGSAHLGSLYSHHGIPGYPASPLYPPSHSQYNGKDPLRR